MFNPIAAGRPAKAQCGFFILVCFFFFWFVFLPAPPATEELKLVFFLVKIASH